MSDPICGIEFKSISQIDNDHVDIFNTQKFAFVTVPLSEKNKNYEFQPLEIYNYGFEWGSKVIGAVPDNVNVDSADSEVRSKSVNLLKKSLKLACYIGVNTVMFNLNNDKNTNLARLCAYHLHESHGRPMWFRLAVGEDSDHEWNKWNNFLSLLPESQNKVGLVLELTEKVPSERDMMRWYSEVLLGISISTELFVSNKCGYPVLRREFQNLLATSFKNKVQVVIHGEDLHGKGMDAYQKYIYNLYENKEPLSVYEDFSRGYEELLQIPLQPLKDNLDNSTYEIFEKDPIKYKQYEEAVYQILLDRGSPVPGGEPTSQVVMVVGAGRGPLVRASLNASRRSKIPVKVYAVEKNESALIILRNLIKDPFFSEVTIVDSDMRKWEPPEKADILVSELLGSFSDNELSPECLDGAQRLMKPDGLSVPCEYTSYLAPMSSRKLYNNVANQASESSSHEDSFHLGYVVRLQAVNLLDKVQPCFKFVHPNTDPVVDNSRHLSLEFNTDMDTVLHGFAGYFDAKLYRDVYISTHPDTHSKDMFSWFPMFFPVKHPLLVRKGEKIVVDFWRVVDDTKVWYEWGLSSPVPQAIHNSRGVSYWIGLFS
ncbi:protein arginine N-methyltransferase 5-like [Bolinopsis microptera]|uniref:protein arginine N-methyltransferase 5-like n=1 Tax=Bolinopsis microptera TaxID=2820187 RepID=UPI00307AB82A